MKLERIKYSDLNARQKENFNFQKVSAILADYGYVTLRLSDDWQGADFIALHTSGDVLRVQLKSRLTFDKKYKDKGLYVAFGNSDAWYLYPHDELLAKILKTTTLIGSSRSWIEEGAYNFPSLSRELGSLMAPYLISGDTKSIPE
ncbi:MAG: hypothetical protein WA005_06315 [Candidatus Binataceae bacterium]